LFLIFLYLHGNKSDETKNSPKYGKKTPFFRKKVPKNSHLKMDEQGQKVCPPFPVKRFRFPLLSNKRPARMDPFGPPLGPKREKYLSPIPKKNNIPNGFSMKVFEPTGYSFGTKSKFPIGPKNPGILMSLGH